MSCTVHEREQVRAAAAHLGALPQVLGVDVLDPATDPTDAWTVEATLTEPVGPRALRALADAGLTLREAAPRADHHVVVATI